MPAHVRKLTDIAVLVVLLAPILLLPLAGGPAAAQDPIEGRAATKQHSWQDFPLMITNITPEDVPAVASLVDVVSYYTTFAPYEAVNGRTQQEADELAFRLDLRVLPLIQAAEQANLHLTITPALLAHSGFADNPIPLLIGDGAIHVDTEPDPDVPMLFVNPAVVPGCNQLTDEACIRVPTHYDQVTPEYIDYWAARLPNFFQAVADVDPTDRVWGIYGSEEVRPWDTREYEAQRRLRQAIDDHLAMQGKPLLAYSPHNRLPEHLAATLIAAPNVSDAIDQLLVSTLPADPRTFLPTWNDPICKRIEPGCHVTGFTDYYPLDQAFGRDVTGGLIPMQDHLMRGSYLGLMMGADSHRNRIASIHRMDVQLETVEHVRNAYQGLGLEAPPHLAFHLPGMNLCTLAEAQTTSAEARHDFWSGFHRGQGIFIYNYQFVVQAENGVFSANCDQLPTPQQVLTVWDEYRLGLRLVKNTLRQYKLEGEVTEPVVFSEVHASVSPTISGTDYLIDDPIPGANATFAMPDYPALNGSAYRLGNIAYLVITSSFDQPIRFTLPFEDPICSVSVAHGDGSTVSFTGNELSDSFVGIDGRVYRLALAQRGSC